MQMRGTIVRLQLQRAPLKPGPAQRRWYDPAPLLALPQVVLSEGGIVDDDGRLDVHHPNHPSGKNIGKNGVSVGFSAHYDAMRERFGTHLTHGIAGESILVQTDGMVTEEDLRDGLVILAQDGRGAGSEPARVHLTNFMVAEPCVEFTRYALQYPPDSRSDEAVTDALAFLRGGMRGYYATYDGPPVTLRVGDRVLL
jgi:hypothetical protein